MSSLSIILVVLSALQPVVIGHLVIVGFGRLLNSDSEFDNYGNLRNKANVNRVYECATNSKAASKTPITLNTTTLLLTYLVYDVDLIFLLPMLVLVSYVTLVELLTVFIFIALFLIGLAVDFKKGGLI
jgi:NADH:ubiquinone oxidoreductase subunit 3 (subunit A)